MLAIDYENLGSCHAPVPHASIAPRFRYNAGTYFFLISSLEHDA
jgi:hypothetical protein